MTLPQWMPRFLEAARVAMEFLLLIAIAYLVAKITWLILAPGPAVSPLQPRPLPSPIGQSADSAARADLSLLMTTNPFEATGAAIEIVPDAPETQLNLKLVALFMSTGDAGGSATIVTPNGETTRYELGDDIINGVVLERILSDRVIISRNGAEETLMRSGRDSGLSVIGDGSTTRSEANRVRTDAPANYTPGVRAATLMAGIDAVPETGSSGQISGFVLRPRGDASLMQSAGLQPGDRLVEINGSDLSQLDPAALTSRFLNTPRVNVTIIRNGERRSLDINFEID
ncbi:type II secretion system protein N [Henriciella sp. AS95]|uniref:type II secretion system protein N n=1 Tax=Henriciella sp. AS95 TaxID=3135782 RepID=UPI003173E925